MWLCGYSSAHSCAAILQPNMVGGKQNFNFTQKVDINLNFPRLNTFIANASIIKLSICLLLLLSMYVHVLAHDSANLHAQYTVHNRTRE